MLVGIVQQVGDGEKKAFSNFDELWSILNPKKRGAHHAEKQKPRGKKTKDNGVAGRF